MRPYVSRYALLAFVIAWLVSATPASAQTGHVDFTTPKSNFVMISVGGGKPIPAVFDAGSIGLLVFGPALGKNDAVATKDPVVVKDYGSSTQYHVSFATAKISIGGLTTTKPVKIGVIFEHSCAAAHPCAAQTGATLKAAMVKSKRYAILGVGPGTGSLENPLQELPAPYSDGYVVSNSGITLGTSNTSDFKQFSLAPTPVGPHDTHSTRYKAYVGQYQACITIASVLQNHCMTAIFDTGNGTITIPTSVLATLPTTPTAAHIRVANVYDWSFTGSRHAKDYPFASSHASHLNTGLPILLDYDVEVSFKNGTYGFRALPKPLPLGSLRQI
jgi:hypothetical protein